MHLNAFKKCLRQMEHQFKELKKKSAHKKEKEEQYLESTTFLTALRSCLRKARQNGREKEANFFKDYRTAVL